MSLAAMEAELKPKVLETFDKIANTYKKLRKQQDKKLEQQVAGEQGSRQQQKAYEKIRDEVIVDVKSLALNNNRIESLVEQLYGINKKLVALEGKLMRLADSYGVARTDFVDDGREIGLLWLQPHLSQSVGNDGFHAGRYPRTPRAIRPRKKRRDTAVLPIPGEVIVDLPGRKAQFCRCPADRLPHWQVAVENPVKFASDPNGL